MISPYKHARVQGVNTPVVQEQLVCPRTVTAVESFVSLCMYEISVCMYAATPRISSMDCVCWPDLTL